ncbi:MAG: HEAT repeat domain-containing protein, partial [Candidatus Aminicenantes bacterium]|nr:HEAT repeat domain-containing protein [Candidatus Aminicenantes bacterium]
AQETDDLDGEMIQALLRTLNDDPNVNLRLAAAESLAGQARNPAVRRGLIESIDRQESPLVQLALADILLDLGEKGAAPSLDRLLQRRDLDYGVKRRLEAVRSQLL